MTKSKCNQQYRYIDCHLHLQDARLHGQLNEIIQRAIQAGVCRFVCNGTSEDDWQDVSELAHQYEEVIPAFGLHPWFIAKRSLQWKKTLRAYLNKHRSCVGEIGLDHWIEPRDEADQVEVLVAQLDLARELNRPVTLHCLRAWNLLLEILRSQDPLPHGFHLHAYGGPEEIIPELIELGAYFSFAGNILTQRRNRIKRIVSAVPANRLLSETDAPDMPVPPNLSTSNLQDAEGKRLSEPADLPIIVNTISELTTNNNQRIPLSEIVFANGRILFSEMW